MLVFQLVRSYSRKPLELCVRAQTLKALREAIVRLFGPDGDHPFRLIVLARNRTQVTAIH